MDGEHKMFFSIRDQHSVPSEPVDNHIGKTSVEPQFYSGFFAGVHLEQPVGVLQQGFSGKLRAGGP